MKLPIETTHNEFKLKFSEVCKRMFGKKYPAMGYYSAELWEWISDSLYWAYKMGEDEATKEFTKQFEKQEGK